MGRVGSTPTATIPWLKRKPHMFSENQAYEVENRQDCEIVDSQWQVGVALLVMASASHKRFYGAITMYSFSGRTATA